MSVQIVLGNEKTCQIRWNASAQDYRSNLSASNPNWRKVTRFHTGRKCTSLHLCWAVVHWLNNALGFVGQVRTITNRSTGSQRDSGTDRPIIKTVEKDARTCLTIVLRYNKTASWKVNKVLDLKLQERRFGTHIFSDLVNEVPLESECLLFPVDNQSLQRAPKPNNNHWKWFL